MVMNCIECGKHLNARNNTGYCMSTPACRHKRDQIKNAKLHNVESRLHYRRENPDAQLWSSAKKRAADRGIPFSITRGDIRTVMTDTCPVFGEHIYSRAGDKPHTYSPWSMSLDRINPSDGYVPGNIQILSHKANAMKSDATPQELIQFADWIYSVYGEGVV
jgi:hypothetical protein